MTGELAIRKAQSRNRSTEAVLARALKAEAWLEHHAAQRGANGLASELQGIRRQICKAHGARSLNLNGAGNRAIGIDTALTARPFKAGVAEHLADDEAAGFIGAHLAGCRRQRRCQANHQCNATQHSPYSR